jgi:hypothetical protein
VYFAPPQFGGPQNQYGGQQQDPNCCIQ